MFLFRSCPPRPPTPAPQATRSFGLLVLVSALIDYGREFTATLRQHGTAALGFSVRHFGTDDVALISDA